MEPAELSDAPFESRLRWRLVSHHAHCGVRDALFPAARLSAGVLSFVSRRSAQGTSLSARHRPALGQLPGSWLCLENHSRQRRRSQRFSAISAHHPRTSWLPPIQSFRRRLRLAARRIHLLLHPDHHRFAALHHRAARKALVLPMSAPNSARRAPFLTAYAALVFAFVYLPIVVLIAYSFNRDGVGGFPPRHLTFDWYRQLFADAPIWNAVLNSLIVAAGSVGLALTLGLLAALALDRAEFPGKALFRRLVLLPFILPCIITA